MKAQLRVSVDFKNNSSRMSHEEFDTVSPNVVLALALSFVSVLAVVENLFTILCFFSGKQVTLRVSNWYVLGQAVTDLCFGLIPLPAYSIIAALGTWPMSRQMCQLFNYLRFVVEQASPLMTVLISWDRLYLLSCRYDFYIRSRRKPRVFCQLCSAWLIPMLGHFSSFLLWTFTVSKESRIAEYSPDCLDIPSKEDIPYSAVYAVITIFLPGACILFCNIGIGVKAYRRYYTRKVDVYPGSNHVNSQSHEKLEFRVNTLSLRDEASTVSQSRTSVYTVQLRGNQQRIFLRRLTRGQNNISEMQEWARYFRPIIMLCMLVAVFLICWIPFSCYFLYIHFICPSCLNKTTHLWLACLLYSNSCINPVIYAIANRPIKKCGKKILLGWYRRLCMTSRIPS